MTACPVMAGAGRPSTSFLDVATKVVYGRAKSGHDGSGTVLS